MSVLLTNGIQNQNPVKRRVKKIKSIDVDKNNNGCNGVENIFVDSEKILLNNSEIIKQNGNKSKSKKFKFDEKLASDLNENVKLKIKTKIVKKSKLDRKSSLLKQRVDKTKIKLNQKPKGDAVGTTKSYNSKNPFELVECQTFPLKVYFSDYFYLFC